MGERNVVIINEDSWEFRVVFKEIEESQLL